MGYPKLLQGLTMTHNFLVHTILILKASKVYFGENLRTSDAVQKGHCKLE